MPDYKGFLLNIVQDFNAGSSPAEITFKYRTNLNQIRSWAENLDKNSRLYRQVQSFLATGRLHLTGRVPDGSPNLNAENDDDVVSPPPPPPVPSGTIDELSISDLQVDIIFTLVNTTTAVIQWGDGETTPVEPGSTTAAHTYADYGNYVIILGNDGVEYDQTDAALVPLPPPPPPPPPPPIEPLGLTCETATSVNIGDTVCATSDGSTTYWLAVQVPADTTISILSTVPAQVATQSGGCVDPFPYENGATPLTVAAVGDFRELLIAYTPDEAGEFCVNVVEDIIDTNVPVPTFAWENRSTTQDQDFSFTDFTSGDNRITCAKYVRHGGAVGFGGVDAFGRVCRRRRGHGLPPRISGQETAMVWVRRELDHRRDLQLPVLPTGERGVGGAARGPRPHRRLLLHHHPGHLQW